jgi:GAF domain-containing protein
MRPPTALTWKDNPTVHAALLDLVAQVDGSMHASIAVLADGRLIVIATTNSDLDAETPSCVGPATKAASSGRITRVPTVERNTEFPAFVSACRQLGVSSVAAFPIRSADEPLAVLTVTSTDHHGFGAADLRACRDAANSLAELLLVGHHAPACS